MEKEVMDKLKYLINKKKSLSKICEELELKDYEVAAFYNGSAIYKSVSNSSYIRVAKADTKFVAQNITTLPNIETQIPRIKFILAK